MTKTADTAVIDPFEAALGVSDVKGRSPWEDAWHRLLKNRAAVVSAFIMGVIILLVVFGPMLISWESDFTDWDNTSAPPSLESGHWFGTDAVGRDILVRTLEGGRISLLVGLVATIVSLLIGVSYGAVAGYFGGATDRIMMRVVDIIYALPFMFFVILLMVVFGRHILLIFVAIGAINWLDMARIVRGQTLSLKNAEFIEAARASGVSDLDVIRRHIIPNLLGVVIVYVTLTIPPDHPDGVIFEFYRARSTGTNEFLGRPGERWYTGHGIRTLDLDSAICFPGHHALLFQLYWRRIA